MKWLTVLSVVLLFGIAAVHTPYAAHAVQPSQDVIDADNGDVSKLTPQERANSDGLMKGGLADLQSAASALQSGNVANALTSMRSAYSEMKQAAPVYHGHRRDALIDTRKAGRILDANRANAAQNASSLLNAAIGEAQVAVANW